MTDWKSIGNRLGHVVAASGAVYTAADDPSPFWIAVAAFVVLLTLDAIMNADGEDG